MLGHRTAETAIGAAYWEVQVRVQVPQDAAVYVVKLVARDKMGTTIKGYRRGGTVQRRVRFSFGSQVLILYTKEGSVQDVQVQQ